MYSFTIDIAQASARLRQTIDRCNARRAAYDPIVDIVCEPNEHGLLCHTPLRATEAAMRHAATLRRFQEAQDRLAPPDANPKWPDPDPWELLTVKDAGARVPKFSAVAYSGGIIGGAAAGVPGINIFADLSGLTVHRKVNLFLGDDSSHRVGLMSHHSTDGKRLIVRGAMSAVSASRAEVLASAHDGYPWQVIPRFELMEPQALPAGETCAVNGRTLTGPAVYSHRPNLHSLILI